MGNLAAGKEAVRLTPSDPDAHLANAEVLSLANQAGESVLELERAAALRPSDYMLWLTLGLMRDQMGNTSAALAAFDEAVKRAPFYAQPRWQRGNLLLRTGQYDAAFKDLNLAAQSDPALISNLLDLAWAISKGDPKLTEQLAQVNTEKMRIAFAKFLATQGKAMEALAQFRSIGMVPIEVRRELIDQLLVKGAFKEANEIWRRDQTVAGSSIYDGGFEAPLTFEQVGFGWRVPRTLQAITLALDPGKAHSGSKSLKIEFGGDSTPSSPSISQLILVEPSRRYRLSLAARSQDVVSGGLPLVVINDAAGDRKLLGQSAPLSSGSRDWQIISFEFNSQPTTAAVLMGIQRENCKTSPCPAFGSIWLDSFSLEQLR